MEMDEFVGAAGYNVSVHRSFLHIVCLTLIKVTTDKQIAPQKQLFDLFPGCNPDAKGLILPIFSSSAFFLRFSPFIFFLIFSHFFSFFFCLFRMFVLLFQLFPVYFSVVLFRTSRGNSKNGRKQTITFALTEYTLLWLNTLPLVKQTLRYNSSESEMKKKRDNVV